MKSLGDTLKSCLKSELSPSIIASRWLAHFAPKGATWSLEEVEGQLMRCLSDVPSGTRFFFEELERAMVLLDLLGVPRSERMSLFEMADRIIAASAQDSPRLVIDVTPWPAVLVQGQPFFAAVQQQFPVSGPLSPTVLVVTEEQVERLARGFVDLGTGFKLERVASSEAGFARTRQLAGDHALIVAPRRYDPFERWAAVRFDGKQMLLEPVDALQVFANANRLASLPPVEHSLATLLGDRPLPQVKLPGNPVELRKLMVALRTEAGATALKLAPEVRLACARVLGIDVTSTARERVKFELAHVAQDLQIEVRTGTAEELKELLEQAKTRFVSPTAMRVGDDLHLVNPTRQQIAAAPPGARIHALQEAPPVLSQLLEEVDGWTDDDFALDPGLTSVMEGLDPDGLERLGFLHARAGLVWSEALRPSQGELVENWREGLVTLLEGEPPPAELRLKSWHNRDRYKGRSQPLLFVALEVDPGERCPDPVRSALAQLTPDAHRLLGTQPAISTIIASRTDRLTVNSYHKKWYGEYEGGLTYREPAPPSILIPRDPAQARNPELWAELYHGSSAFHMLPESGWFAPRGHRFAFLKGLEYWQTLPFEIDARIWKTADLELALAWLAIKQAATNSGAARLHDGTVLLPLASGIFAEIYLRKSGMKKARRSHGKTRANLEVTCELAFGGNPEARLQELVGPVTTHLATTTTSIGKAVTELGYSLPTRIHLVGHGLHATISFLASPFYMSGGSAAAGAAIAGGAVGALEDQQAAEKAARLDVVTFEDDE